MMIYIAQIYVWANICFALTPVCIKTKFNAFNSSVNS